MTDLLKVDCEACQIGSPQATDEEIALYMKQLPEWNITIIGGTKHITKSFKFKDFADALAFTNRVGAFAEEKKHHPDMLLRWGEVVVTWWTHKINGLHLTDFVCAANTDKLKTAF